MPSSPLQHMPNHDTLVDARALLCPIPVLRARLEVNRMLDGQVLLLLATDASTGRDFPVFAEQCGHLLLGVAEVGGVYLCWMKVRKPILTTL